jgi:hypothetical protein
MIQSIYKAIEIEMDASRGAKGVLEVRLHADKAS